MLHTCTFFSWENSHTHNELNFFCIEEDKRGASSSPLPLTFVLEPSGALLLTAPWEYERLITFLFLLLCRSEYHWHKHSILLITIIIIIIITTIIIIITITIITIIIIIINIMIIHIATQSVIGV